MRAFAIFPKIDTEDSSFPACHGLIVELVCDCMRANGDTFHVTVDWRDPGAGPNQGITDGLARPHVIDLAGIDDLREVVRLSTDPYSGRGTAVIRSKATCRAVTFGFDGQAFLCLRHKDEIPISPDLDLVGVEEQPELLFETDYFDGFVQP